MPDLKNGPVTLHYQTTGKGPALILIGGLGMPIEGWGLQTQALSRSFFVIRFDNRGCGRSSTPDFPYTIRDMAGDVLALMNHLKLDRSHILGLSMGGFIALELALLVPDRIQSLVLAHTAPKMPDLARQRLMLWQSLREAGVPDRTMALEQLVWVFPEKAMEKEKAVEALLNNLILGQDVQSLAGFKGQTSACLKFDVTGQMDQIQVPALLVSSQDDISIPLRHTRKLEHLPEFKKIKIFPYGGHVSHLVHADEFNGEVHQFLSQ